MDRLSPTLPAHARRRGFRRRLKWWPRSLPGYSGEDERLSVPEEAERHPGMKVNNSRSEWSYARFNAESSFMRSLSLTGPHSE